MSGSKNKVEDHLKYLSERNRLRKLQGAKSKSELEQEHLERGFSTHFRGANATPSKKNSTFATKQGSGAKTNSVQKVNLFSGNGNAGDVKKRLHYRSGGEYDYDNDYYGDDNRKSEDNSNENDLPGGGNRKWQKPVKSSHSSAANSIDANHGDMINDILSKRQSRDKLVQERASPNMRYKDIDVSDDDIDAVVSDENIDNVNEQISPQASLKSSGGREFLDKVIEKSTSPRRLNSSMDKKDDRVLGNSLTPESSFDSVSRNDTHQKSNNTNTNANMSRNKEPKTVDNESVLTNDLIQQVSQLRRSQQEMLVNLLKNPAHKSNVLEAVVEDNGCTNDLVSIPSKSIEVKETIEIQSHHESGSSRLKSPPRDQVDDDIESFVLPDGNNHMNKQQQQNTSSPKRQQSDDYPFVQINRESSSFSNAVFNMNGVIRIRIYSNWKDSKYSALDGLRLCVLPKQHEKDEAVELDVYKYFNVELFEGLDLLTTNTSDTYRLLGSLLSNNTVVEGIENENENKRGFFLSAIFGNKSKPTTKKVNKWYGAASLHRPIEIRLTPLATAVDANMLYNDILSILGDTVGEEDVLASHLFLKVQNFTGTHDKKSLVSAVKDVDIYYYNKCIFSSTIPLMDNAQAPFMVSLLQKAVDTRRSSDTDTANVDGDNMVAPNANDDKETAVEITPSWLNELKPISRPNSARYSSYNVSREKQEQSNFLGHQDGSASHDHSRDSRDISNSNGKSIREKKMSRNNSKASMGKSSLDNMLTSNSMNRVDDEKLRQSINALSMADKSNMGRLSRDRLHNRASNEMIPPNPENEHQVLLTNSDDSSLNGVNKDEATNSFTAINHQSQEKAEQSPQNDDSQLRRKYSSRRLLHQRNHQRIDQVQEKVHSALAGLANIMSDLQIKSVRSKESLFDQHSPVQNEISTEATTNNKVIKVSPEMSMTMDDEMLFIPTLPIASSLRIEIISTWGDRHYVGLNAVDIFDVTGARLSKGNSMIKSITSDPTDINILPEYDNDPRVVDNLVDGTSYTRDDLHVWLAPLGYHSSSGSTNNDDDSVLAEITVTFSTPVQLSMIRIFNYNKSRTYGYRGARMCRLYLDDKLTFSGEIRMGPGNLTSVELASEVILFTTDESILQKIAKHDELKGYYLEDSTSKWVSKLMDRHQMRRPSTADRQKKDQQVRGSGTASTTPTEKISRYSRIPTEFVPSPFQNNSRPVEMLRPRTQAGEIQQSPPASETAQNLHVINERKQSPMNQNQNRKETDFGDVIRRSNDEDEDEDDFMAQLEALNSSLSKNNPLLDSKTFPSSPTQKHEVGDIQDTHFENIDKKCILCSEMTFVLEDNYGDDGYIGLSGIEILAFDPFDKKITCHSINPSQIKACPEGMSVLGYADDPRKAQNLVNGINSLSNDAYMWLVPYTPGGTHCFRIEFGTNVNVIGIRVWNYNKGSRITYECPCDEYILRGTRTLSLWANVSKINKTENTNIGRMILRRGPGYDCIDFRQLFYLEDIQRGLHLLPQQDNNNMQTEGGGTSSRKYVTPPLNQDYEVPLLPCGQLWKFIFYENWDDEYYIGLDGLEFMDACGNKITPASMSMQSNRMHITALPSSLNDLDVDTDDGQDPRTPDRLLFDAEESAPGQAKHTPWLAPLSRSMSQEEKSRVFRQFNKKKAPHYTIDEQTYGKEYYGVYPDDNTLFVFFDEPVTVSLIRLYNYSKTPQRGVKKMGIYVDGDVIFMGAFRKADA